MNVKGSGSVMLNFTKDIYVTQLILSCGERLHWWALHHMHNNCVSIMHNKHQLMLMMITADELMISELLCSLCLVVGSFPTILDVNETLHELVEM